MNHSPQTKLTPEKLGERIYNFALQIVVLTKTLPKNEFSSRILGEQLLKSSTSILANYEEARGAVSHAEFTCKLGIAYKECRESVMWLSLISDSGIIEKNDLHVIINEAKELRAILGTSMKTANNRQRL